MHTVYLKHPRDFEEWRTHARTLFSSGIPPEAVLWRTGAENDLFSMMADPKEPSPPETASPGLLVPRQFPDLAESALHHSNPSCPSLLYRLLFRMQSERKLLAVMTDPDVISVRAMVRDVHNDCHRMMAFVRFREIATEKSGTPTRRRFMAWHEPDHYIVARMAPFFRRRFSDMDWAILTPKGSAACTDGKILVSDEPATRPNLADDTDDLWRTYYASTFNPARLKVKTMQSNMPKRYWANLPEAEIIPELIAGARARVSAMIKDEEKE